MTTPPKPFQLVAGDPSLDLINTLDNRFVPTGPGLSGPVELLNTYQDLLRFLVQSSLLTERQQKKLLRLESTPAQRNAVLTHAKAFRETLATLAYAQLDNQPIPTQTLAHLETLFQQTQQHRILSTEDNSLLWTWPKLSRHLDSPIWLLTNAAQELFLTPHSSQIRTCASDTCRWLFLDTSKNHTRRWCDMKICGNRNKARTFQARQSAH